MSMNSPPQACPDEFVERVSLPGTAGRPCQPVSLSPHRGCGDRQDLHRRWCRIAARCVERLLLVLGGLGGLGGLLGVFLQVFVEISTFELARTSPSPHRPCGEEDVADRRLHLVIGLGTALLAVFQANDVPAVIGLHGCEVSPP